MLLVLLIISRLSVLLHKHPHELLDSVVKEHFDQAFRLNRSRAFYASHSCCQALFRNFRFYSSACTYEPLLIQEQLSSTYRRLLKAHLSTAFTNRQSPGMRWAYRGLGIEA